jgi:predicted MFS family arabinose efflux permease
MKSGSDSNFRMLFALGCAFMLSQAFRTVTAMMAKALQADFALTAQQLGVFAGTFHFTFGAMQLFMGIGIDLHGVRRTVLTAFPLAVAGSLLSALAQDFAWVVAGQALIGIGCAPAFLACTVFIARKFPVQRFASLSGLTMGVGGIGMLLTATPLAWVVQHRSWRTGFLILAAASALAWLTVLLVVREERPSRGAGRESPWQAVGQFAKLFAIPHTWGIVVLGAVTYASFITLRGLWLGPLLVERYGFGLVAAGNVALAVSVVSLFGPPLFGRFEPGASRRTWIIGFTASMALLFAVLAFVHAAALAVVLALVISFLTGYIVLQYADVRGAYPEALTGRAMAVFTMAMFLGIALMQWLTGVAATLATAHGVDPFEAVMGATAALLAVGACAFRLLPQPSPAR